MPSNTSKSINWKTVQWDTLYVFTEMYVEQTHAYICVLHVRGGSWEFCAWRWKGTSAPFSISPAHPLARSTLLLRRFAKKRDFNFAIEIVFSRVGSRARARRRRSFCAARDEIWVCACTINARQVYRARFSWLRPSCLSSHPFHSARVSQKSRVSLKIDRLLIYVWNLNPNCTTKDKKRFFFTF